MPKCQVRMIVKTFDPFQQVLQVEYTGHVRKPPTPKPFPCGRGVSLNSTETHPISELDAVQQWAVLGCCRLSPLVSKAMVLCRNNCNPRVLVAFFQRCLEQPLPVLFATASRKVISISSMWQNHNFLHAYQGLERVQGIDRITNIPRHTKARIKETHN